MPLTPCHWHHATTRCQLLLAAVNGTVARVCDSAAPVVMQCPAGSLIAVSDAVYGRPSDSSCPGPAGSCSVANVASMIKARCDKQASCILTGDTYKTNDPCNMVLKELRVDYTCQGELAYSGMPLRILGQGALGCMLHAWCCCVGHHCSSLCATRAVSDHALQHSHRCFARTCLDMPLPCNRLCLHVPVCLQLTPMHPAPHAVLTRPPLPWTTEPGTTALKQPMVRAVLVNALRALQQLAAQASSALAAHGMLLR
jgi:hypothetical protein